MWLPVLLQYKNNIKTIRHIIIVFSNCLQMRYTFTIFSSWMITERPYLPVWGNLSFSKDFGTGTFKKMPISNSPGKFYKSDHHFQIYWATFSLFTQSFQTNIYYTIQHVHIALSHYTVLNHAWHMHTFKLQNVVTSIFKTISYIIIVFSNSLQMRCNIRKQSSIPRPDTPQNADICL